MAASVDEVDYASETHWRVLEVLKLVEVPARDAFD